MTPDMSIYGSTPDYSRKECWYQIPGITIGR